MTDVYDYDRRDPAAPKRCPMPRRGFPVDAFVHYQGRSRLVLQTLADHLLGEGALPKRWKQVAEILNREAA